MRSLLKYKIFSVLFFIFTFTTLAQSTVVKGVVYDSDKVPVVYSSIVYQSISNPEDNGFKMTDSIGHYSMRLKLSERYLFEIKSFGYHPISREVVAEKGTILTHVLIKKTDSLDTIVINADIRPIIDNDSIRVYDVNKFNKGNEKKLKDVLRNLPGIQISETGDIYFEGKKINDLNVEGEKFFNGGTRLASNSLPAHVISAIEILKSSPANLDSSISDRITLNVKLNKSNSKFWFGDLTAATGVGGETRYQVSPLLFYYSKPTRFNSINKLSNNGETPLSTEDYIDYKGGLNTLINNYESLNFNSTLLRDEINRKSFYDEDVFSANNFNKKFKKEINISTNFLLFKNYSLMENTSLIEYNDVLNDNEKRNSSAVTTGYLIDFNLELEKKFKYNNSLKFELISQNELSNNNQNVFSSFSNVINTISENSESSSLGNMFKLNHIKKWNSKLRLTSDINYEYNTVKNNLKILSSQNLFNNSDNLIESGQPFLQQFYLENDNLFLKHELSNLINTKINLTVGLENEQLKSHSRNFIKKNLEMADEAVLFTARTISFKPYITLKSKWKNFYFNMNSSLLFYSIENNNNTITKSIQNTVYTYDATINYSPSNKIDYSISSAFNVELPNHFAMFDFQRVMSFNTVLSGNSDLDRQGTHTYSTYFNYQPKLGRNLSLSLKYDIIKDPIRRTLNVQGNNIIYSKTNLINPEKQFLFDLAYFSNLTSDSSFRINLSNTNINSINLLNEVSTDLLLRGYNLNILWRKNWSKSLTSNASIGAAYNRINSQNLNSEIYNVNLINIISFNLFNSTKTILDSSSNLNLNNDNDYQILNRTNLLFDYSLKNSMFSYGLEIRNIFNNRSQLGFQNGISTAVQSSQTIQPRTFMFRISLGF